MSNEVHALEEAPTTPAPKKTSNSLQDTPEIADRYVKTYANSGSDTPVRDPQRFSVRPPAWTRWTDARYMRFIDYVRKSIDMLPFAEQEQIPVEEVQHLFTYTICDQLYNHVEMLRKRAEARMEHHVKLLATHGTPMRKWTKECIKGELCRIRAGEIDIIDAEGSKIKVNRADLTEQDLAYLVDEISQHQWNILHLEKGEKNTKKRKLEGVESAGWEVNGDEAEDDEHARKT